MTSFLYRMPSGVPGDISRRQSATVAARVLGGAFAAFGLFGKLSAGKLVPLTGNETAAQLDGLLVRSFPMTGANASDPLGTAVPPTSGVADVLKRGYMTVKVNAGTAAIGGTVYVRVAAATGPKPLGGIEAVADATNTVALTNAAFESAADASGNAEISFNL